MARVLKEMAVVVGNYEDRKTGQTKNRYKNIGVQMEAESNGEMYTFLLLDKTFNPAGVPSKNGDDKILISLFEPRDRNGETQQRNQQRTEQNGDSGYGSGGRPNNNMDDSIPF